MNTSWDLTLLFKNEEPTKIDQLLNDITSKWQVFIDRWENSSEYLSSSSVLKKALDEYEFLFSTIGLDGGLSYYFELKESLDQGNPQIKAHINKIDEFTSNLYTKIQFFTHRISKIDPKIQDIFLKAKELKNYKHYLFRLFQESKHILTEDQEKVLTLVSKPATYNWRQMVESFVANDEEKVLTEEGTIEKVPTSKIGAMIDTRNTNVRESAAKALYKISKRWAPVAENEINSLLEYKKTIDNLRGFNRPDSSRHLADDIDSEVVDAMVESVVNKYDIVKDYFKFKASVLGKKKLKAHEALLGIEYLDNSINTSNIRKYSLEEAVKLVGNVFENLDSEFKTIFTKFFEEGRVDSYPKKGKINGAFCASVHKNQPIYILLNFTGKMQDCLTLAHEMGHGINDELMKIQNELNYGTVLSTAEVASTFMEDFVWQDLINGVDEEQRFVLMMQKIEDDIGTIFMQVACYSFEKSLHTEFREKGYLSKEDISKIFLDSFRPLFGKYVDFNKTGFKWVTWTHIRTFFYVYSYASGLLISKSLQNSVKLDKNYINQVKKFLSAGTSKSPKDIFMELGIDITKPDFWSKGLKEIESLIGETKLLAIKLGKYK